MKLEQLSRPSPTKNGESNKLAFVDRAAHDWYRFVLSFPPHLVRNYLAKWEINSKQTVLDPFCGTGTTIVECKKLGIKSIGIEANPIAHFASSVKTEWGAESEELLSHAERIARAAHSELNAQGIPDHEPLQLFSISQKMNDYKLSILRTIDEDQMKILLANSISPVPLHKTLIILDHIRNNNGNKQFERYELLALAKALVYSISNLHFGPEVGIGKIRNDAPVVSLWLTEVKSICADLQQLHKLRNVSSKVHKADARQIGDILPPRSIDAIITSPPYPNEKDYTRTTRLESVILGFLKNKEELRAIKRTLVRSNTRSVYKTDDDDKWISKFPKIQKIAETIEARRIELGKTSGFERLYPRLTKLYFGGMARHLSDMRTILKPGARLAYVVGDQASYLRVMIRTGQILSEIATSLGYELVAIDLFRTRLATATKEQLREEIVVLKWPG